MAFQHYLMFNQPEPGNLPQNRWSSFNEMYGSFMAAVKNSAMLLVSKLQVQLQQNLIDKRQLCTCLGFYHYQLVR